MYNVGSPAGPGSPPTMSESEREDIRQQLAETLGEREVAKALTEARWGIQQLLFVKTNTTVLLS